MSGMQPWTTGLLSVWDDFESLANSTLCFGALNVMHQLPSFSFMCLILVLICSLHGRYWNAYLHLEHTHTQCHSALYHARI